MLKSNSKNLHLEMLSTIKSKSLINKLSDHDSSSEEISDTNPQEDQTQMEIDISQAVKSSSSISSSSSVSTSSLSPKNQLNRVYNDEDDLPIDLSAKKSRLNNYYSATVSPRTLTKIKTILSLSY